MFDFEREREIKELKLASREALTTIEDCDTLHDILRVMDIALRIACQERVYLKCHTLEKAYCWN